MSLVPYNPHQPSAECFDSRMPETALIFKGLPGECERLRNRFSTLLRSYSSTKEKKQCEIQTSSHAMLLCLRSLLSATIAG